MPQTSDRNDNLTRTPGDDLTDFSGKLTGESFFNWMLSQERKRTERTGDLFALMLVNVEPLAKTDRALIDKVGRAIISVTRETDITGWYRLDRTIGAIFTTLNHSSREGVRTVIMQKVHRALLQTLTPNEFDLLQVTLYFFPEKTDDSRSGNELNRMLYPGPRSSVTSQRISSLMKRSMDILGSIIALALLSPILLIVAAILRVRDNSPVLRRETRLGQFGEEFGMLKFRPLVAEGQRAEIPLLGGLLRKSRLVGVPQLLNVLTGDMSLVGPRPPAPEEMDGYDIWHRRRIQEAKPGITGLWQVSSSRDLSLDEMVRLDLQYIRKQSLWLDLKILLKTPLAWLTNPS